MKFEEYYKNLNEGNSKYKPYLEFDYDEDYLTLKITDGQAFNTAIEEVMESTNNNKKYIHTDVIGDEMKEVEFSWNFTVDKRSGYVFELPMWEDVEPETDYYRYETKKDYWVDLQKKGMVKIKCVEFVEREDKSDPDFEYEVWRDSRRY